MQEMRARIVFLESELNQIQPASSDIRTKLREIAILSIVVIMAVIPPALVMADRWFNILSTDVMREDWCQSSYLCGTMLPSYFLVVFACAVSLLIFMFFHRREPIVVTENSTISLESSPVSQKQSRIGLYYIIGSGLGFALVVLFSLINNQYPGWNLVYVWLAFLTGCILRTVTQESILEFWKKNGEFWISILLAHLSIIAILVGYYGQPQLFWATVLLLVFGMANLWRFRQRVPLIFWIVSLAMIVFTININGWWTVTIGDEYDFPDYARNLAEKTSFSELGKVLFKANGVFGAHPIFSSILQAISMKLFGSENFGWRFSNPYLCSLGVGLFYSFCKTFISKRLSLIVAFLLAVSSYLMSFGKIGYNK